MQKPWRNTETIISKKNINGSLTYKIEFLFWTQFLQMKEMLCYENKRSSTNSIIIQSSEERKTKTEVERAI